MHHRFMHTGSTALLFLHETLPDRGESLGRTIGAPLSPIPEQDNSRFCSGQQPRPLRDPHAAAERLAAWSEAARLAGRIERADRLLLLAWEAYDRPARTPGHAGTESGLLAA